ncbi:YciI family protein [Exilibacterium tricleocarpae]|uniref:YciI family protein n=1 Tax=Exilibacterium tricleocarpae TaxID=2591008 RepID=A0A545U5H4_9GAMM|nr:YciI family protein [Exilibacterium tricleocarpae]TQV84718.1 YciI family protein [Exilibacterium tricleocarpae]
MHYALLIYQAEGLWEALSAAEQEALLGKHGALQEHTKQQGTFGAAVKLTPSATAITVNKEGGKVTVTDGPFSETKEVLAGFYVFQCDTLEQAIDYAERIPHIQAGKVEIRPIAFSDSRALLV